MPATKNAPFRAAALTLWEQPQELPDGMDYLAYAEETCPTTGKIHYQAFAYATRAKRLSGWKKVFKGAHIEEMRGTFRENEKYCSKQGVLVEFGQKPMENGKRRTLHDLCEEVREGASQSKPLSQIVSETENKATFVQFHSGIKTLYAMEVTERLRKTPRSMAPEVIYIHGKPGCGKTRYVFDHDENVYSCPPDDGYKWKDGYSGQESVLYDNVTAKNITCPARFLMEIDRYFIQVATKGGFIGWRPRRIYITSVTPPESFAELVGFDDPQEFLRRVSSVLEL